MMRKIVTCLLSIAMLILLSVSFLAQDETTMSQDFPTINAQNINQLQSVTQIDFATLPLEAGQFITGRFALSGDGRLIAVVNDENTVILLNDEGEIQGMHTIPDADVIDMAFDETDEHLLSLHYSDDLMTMVINSVDDSEQSTNEFDIDGFPQTLWSDDSGNVWVEIIGQEIEIAQLNLEDETLETIPYAPALDESAVVRIGRIPPPYVVTSSQEGLVKLWNLQSGDVLFESQVEQGLAVFGQIDTDATHLTWRDQASENLYLLNFESGDNQLIATLNGEYVQYFFLTPDADVILAVHLEDRPDVVAWHVETGERYELGEHRDCTRVPDMIRLSRNGTTLVIGCDTGLDIWRIVE
ncbi:MAG: hypothetical protein RLP44_13490 [Aggregatilineales bacterium]